MTEEEGTQGRSFSTYLTQPSATTQHYRSLRAFARPFDNADNGESGLTDVIVRAQAGSKSSIVIKDATRFSVDKIDVPVASVPVL